MAQAPKLGPVNSLRVAASAPVVFAYTHILITLLGKRQLGMRTNHRTAQQHWGVKWGSAWRWLAGLLLMALAQGPMAATLTVTNTADAGAGSLRQAITDAATGDTLVFDAGLAGQTLTLTSDHLIVSGKSITIDGSALSSQLTLDGNGTPPTDNSVGYGAGGIIYVHWDAALTLRALTLQNGRSGAGRGGGAISAQGPLTVQNSTFKNNVAELGAAIHAGSLALLEVSGSTFANNSATVSGGAIYITLANHSTSTITNSSFSGNLASSGSVIHLQTLSLGVSITSTTTLSNNTVSGNATNPVGGGLISFRDITSFGSTNNVTLYNNVVVGNTGTAFVTSQGFFTTIGTDNLCDDVSCVGATQTTASAVALQPLASNGGPTQTLALAVNSVAINAGSDAHCPVTDQRGTSRPQGVHCDVGAFEWVNVAPTFVGSSTTLSVAKNAGATDLKALLQVSDSDVGQTLTWSPGTAPAHGTLTFSSASASSGGASLALADGALSYTPTAAYSGTDSFSVQVSDGSASATRTLTVAVVSVSVSPTTLGSLVVGTPFSQGFSASGGASPYSYDISAGSLPAGLSLGTTSGVLSGTPNTAGAYSFTIQATDSSTGTGAPFSGTQAFSGSVAAPNTSTTGTSPSGGTIIAAFTGGSSGCAYATSAFSAISTVPTTPPAGYSYPHGVLSFTTNNCGSGNTLRFTITYPTAVPANAKYYKYGPEFGGSQTPHWYALPNVAISGNQISFDITDNGVGDSNSVLGIITDPGALAIPADLAGVASVPTLSEWGVILLSSLMALFGIAQARRRRV